MGRNVPRTRRVFFAANGNGPWPCVDCGELVYRIGHNDGHIHHVDHDETNDSPNNLVMMDADCHMKHHHKGKRHSPAHNAKVGRKGRIFTPEWKAKLSAKQYTRASCPNCDYVSSPQWVGRHMKEDKCVQ